MNITVVGNVCIDSNESEKASYTSAGSPAMFMSKIFNKLPDVAFNIISPYGPDFLEYISKASLLPNNPTSEKTLVYENKSRGNERTQKAYNTDSADQLVLGEQELEILNKTDLLYFAPLVPSFSLNLIQQIIAESKQALKILLPQGFYRDFDDENNVIQREFVEENNIVPLFDVVIVSIEDHAQMQEIVARWSQQVKVIMTMGDNGAKYIYKGEEKNISVDKVPVEDIVDSVGSGDIFSATFGYKYFLTKNVEESISFANNIARQCLFYSADNIQFELPK